MLCSKYSAQMKIITNKVIIIKEELLAWYEAKQKPLCHTNGSKMVSLYYVRLLGLRYSRF